MPHLTANGCRLYYTDQGQGEPVVLIHGLGSSTRDWENQTDALRERYRVVCVDMRGHGLSDKPPGKYSIKGFSEDVVCLIEALDLQRPHIVGISMGGMIAFQLATDHPHIAASLTVINSAPEVRPKRAREYAMVAQRLVLAHALPLSVTARGLARVLFPKPDQQTLRHTFEQRWCENDRKAYLASLRAIIGWSVVDQLDRICCPVLVISGDNDYMPIERKREYVCRLGDAHLEVIADSCHATPVDQPEHCNRLILDFLRQCGSARQPQQEITGA